MGKKMTHEEYVERLKEKNPNLEVIGIYINANTKIPHRCMKHNIIFDKRPYNALKGEGCLQCAIEITGNKLRKTHDQYVKEVKEINPNIEVIGIYESALKKLTHKCLIHNYIWEVVPASILQGYGCPLCGMGKQIKQRTKDHEIYIKELADKHSNIEVLEEYKNALTKILHRCKIHNYEWYTTPGSLLSGGNCPKCSKCYKRNHEDYIKELEEKNPNLIAIEKYITVTTPIKHKCLEYNYEWNITPLGALNGNGCPICHREKLSKAKSITHEQYLEDLHKVHPNIEPLEAYKGANEKIKHRCNIDGYEWYVSPACVIRHNCPKCANKLKVTHAEYLERLKQVNPYIEVIGELKNMRSDIKVRCKFDNYEWETRAEVLLRGIRCPICGSKSLGELNIKNYLDNANIQYEYQKRFPNCKDVRPLAFDFYIPDKNICIEYDGIQHFKPIDFAGKGETWANDMFVDNQKRDRIKTEYCNKNNIKLLRIPYYANVEEELNKLLFT